VDLDRDDFRRARRYLAPHLFLGGKKGDTDPPPSDLIPKKKWTGIMDLPTDVALRTSSYDGSVIARLADLHSDWIFSWPDVGDAPYMEEPALLAGEEFDALVFNAMHGYYRQAIGCLRNALEILTVAAGLAVTNNQALYAAWRNGQEISYGQAVAWRRDSQAGQADQRGHAERRVRQGRHRLGEGPIRPALRVRPQPGWLQQRGLLGEQRPGVRILRAPGRGEGVP
jgi:hypothetical protein